MGLPRLICIIVLTCLCPSKADGTFELNLNVNESWTINALDPITLNKGSIAVAANAGLYSGKNIDLAP